MMNLLFLAVHLLACLYAKADSVLDKVLVGEGGEQLKQTINTVADGAKQAWDGAGAVVEGLGQSFGVVSKDYYYNYRVFNDAPAPIFVAEERLTGVMGTNFSGEIKKGLVVFPCQNTRDEFYQRQLYISIWICADENEKEIRRFATSSKDWPKYGTALGAPFLAMGAVVPVVVAVGLGAGLAALAGSIATVVTLHKYKLYEKDIYPWRKNDDNIYFYRAYTYQGSLRAEYLDLKGVTAEFSGQFYNNTSQSVLLKFLKDSVEYIVTLEPGSFNMLQSSSQPNSIRPPENQERGFQFYIEQARDENALAYVPIASEGIAYVTDTSKDPSKPQYSVAAPMLYTYEIHPEDKYGNKVSAQGLSIGNFDQPISGKIRDINPVECHLWYQSADQAQELMQDTSSDQKKYIAKPFNMRESVWVSYKTKDYTFQKRINPGQVLDFTLIRPQLLEQEASLYVLSLKIDDDQKALQFLDRLHQGIIGKDVVKASIERPLDVTTVLTDLEPRQNNRIDDLSADGSGVSGFLLLVDTFLPQGIGTGPFYYQIYPATLRIDQFANVIWYNDDSYEVNKATGNFELKQSVMQDLSAKLALWIDDYRNDQERVSQDVKKYLQEHGNSGIFVANTSSVDKQFSNQGLLLHQTLLTGPVSVKNFPVMRKAGTNYYVLTWGEKPKDWPQLTGTRTDNGA